MKYSRKILSLLLAIMIALTLVPAVAMAEGEQQTVHVTVENTCWSVADGAAWDGVLVDTDVPADENTTMMSAVVAALNTVGATQQGAENNYISDINGLSAGAASSYSGWMGTLNDWFTNEGFGAFTIASGKLNYGDNIKIMYSLTMGEDVGGSWGNNDKTVKSVSVSAGTLSPEFDKDTHEYTLTLPKDTATVKVTPVASNKNFQVRNFVGETRYTSAIPVSEGAVITVKCGDPSWPTMNDTASDTPAEEYKITVAYEKDPDPTPSPTPGGEDSDKDYVTSIVNVEVQQANSYIVNPQTISIDSNTAENYGYSDSVDSKTSVSALDVLVKIHEIMLSNEVFTKDDCKTYLVISDSGFVTTLFGDSGANFSFAINGDYPCDKNGEYGQYGYTGYTINQAAVASGDNVDFFYYQDSYYMDYYTWFEQGGAKVKEITVGAGDEFSLKLKGLMYAYGGALNDEDREKQGCLSYIEDAQITLLNDYVASDISGAVTDENGEVTLKFDKAGTYTVSAYTDYSSTYTAITSPALKVNVIDVAAPVITKDLPKTAEYKVGETPEALTVEANSPDGGTLSYQWYKSTDGKTFTKINGETKNSYVPDTTAAGKTYYKVTVVNTANSISKYTNSTVTEFNVLRKEAKLASLLVHTQFSPNNSNVLIKNTGDSYTNGAVFNSNTFEYTVDLNDSTTQLRFRAKPENSSDKVTLYYEGGSKDIKWTSGSSKFADCLKPGKNNLEIKVASADGTLETIYKITANCYPTLTALGAKAAGAQLYFDKDFASLENEYTLTVPKTAQSVTFNAAAKSADYKILYNGEKSSEVNIAGKDKVEIAVLAGEGENAIHSVYTVNIKRVDQLNFTVKATPSDALVKVYDAKGATVPKNKDGSFSGMFGESKYTYTVTKYGYVAQSGDVPAAGGVINVTLEKAKDSGLTDVGAEWKDFRNSDSNMAITDVLLPTDSENINLKWNKKLGTGWSAAPSVQIIVDNALVTMVGTKIYKLDLETGDVIAQGDMVNSPSYGYTPPIYAEGMIFCPLGGGTIQAFDAKTLKSLWIYKDPKGGQALSPITYSDGYIYTGFWYGETQETNFVCLSVTDEDVYGEKENKTASWKYAQKGGFYWAGSVAVGNAVIVGSDDGQSGSSGDSYLYSFNKYTGEQLSAVKLAGAGDQRSSIAYDSASGKIYFTTKGGYLFSASVDSKGNISALKGVNYNAQSTSTPIVYKGKVYFATGSGISSTGSSGNIVVADADSLEMLYAVGLKGYPQCSLLMTTAYEKSTGYIYLYSTYNNRPGGITMVRIDPTKNTADGAVLTELYDAAGFENYCITSLICGSDGTIYYKNDSGNVLAVGVPRAEGVIKLIAAIPDNVTLGSEDVVKIARNAYNALPEKYKSDVTNYEKLTSAESKIDDLKAVLKVENKIDKIGAVTLESEKTIKSARSAYDKLRDDLKKSVSNYDKLTAAEKAYSELKAKIANVESLIEKAASDITAENISAAQSAYDKLSDSEKSYVTNYNKLSQAKEKLSHMENAKKVEGLINAIGKVTADSKDKISAARNAYNALTKEEQAIVSNYGILTAAERKLEALNPEGSTKVIGKGDTKVTIDGVTYMVDKKAASLMEKIATESKKSQTDTAAVASLWNEYGTLTNKVKAEVFNYDDLKALTVKAGEINRKDEILGVSAEGLEWYMRIKAQKLQSTTAEYKTFEGSLENAEIIELWNIKCINTLTGEETLLPKGCKIKLPYAYSETGDNICAAYTNADGENVVVAANIADGCITFEGEEAENFAVVKTAEQSELVLEDAATEETAVDTGAPAETKQDFPIIWIIIICAGIAAVIIALVLKRKKD